MCRFLRDNALSVTLLAFFVLSCIGEAFSGWRALVQERLMHGVVPVDFIDYLGTGHFLAAVFENWESEFLQMAVYVLLTALLMQKGSPESRKPEAEANRRSAPLSHGRHVVEGWCGACIPTP